MNIRQHLSSPSLGGGSVNGYFPSFKELVLRKGKKTQQINHFWGRNRTFS